MNLENTSDGFTLYQRPPGGRYYMRYSIRGQGQQRASLGTSDASEAQRRAKSEIVTAKSSSRTGSLGSFEFLPTFGAWHAAQR